MKTAHDTAECRWLLVGTSASSVCFEPENASFNEYCCTLCIITIYGNLYAVTAASKYSLSYKLITVLKLVFSTAWRFDVHYVYVQCSSFPFIYDIFCRAAKKHVHIYIYHIVYCILLNECSLYTVSYLCIMCTYTYAYFYVMERSRISVASAATDVKSSMSHSFRYQL